jgi:hypothetical protein
MAAVPGLGFPVDAPNVATSTFAGINLNAKFRVSRHKIACLMPCQNFTQEYKKHTENRKIGSYEILLSPVST